MTRYEKIKSLTIEDMASFLSEAMYDSDEPTMYEVLDYLYGEYTENKDDVLYLSTDGLRKEIEGDGKI